MWVDTAYGYINLDNCAFVRRKKDGSLSVVSKDGAHLLDVEAQATEPICRALDALVCDGKRLADLYTSDEDDIERIMRAAAPGHKLPKGPYLYMEGDE